jgi:nucleotide-binding universal stress UspA family protein
MKSLLVHLDASPRAALRLDIAQALARRHLAELTALYAVLPTMLAVPWATVEGSGAVAAMLADVDREQRQRARAVVQAAASHAAVTWHETGSEALVQEVLQHALYSDLVVLGQTDPGDAQAGALPPDLVASIIVDAGKPALVIPYAGSFGASAQKVLVAWKPTREAARAVTAALPWLRCAEEVHLACASGEGGGRDSAALASLRHWLELHEVGAKVEDHSVAAAQAGEALLSLAADTDAQLLVMGCYGHSRAREWVLGGATRCVLRSMTLPVLMAH